MEEYLGFKTVSLSDEELSSLYSSETNESFGCLTNQYLIVEDRSGEVVELLRYNGRNLVKVPYKCIAGRFLGKIKPKNIQQQLAIDMLYNPDITVKVLTGRFGAGEFCFAPLCSNA